MATSKKTVKVNLLGLIRVETEMDKPMGFNQVLIMCLIGILFVIGLVIVLKAYAMPVTAIGTVKKAGIALLRMIGSFKSGVP